MMSTAPSREIARPYRETKLDPSLRIPRWLALAFGAAVALGPIAAMGARRKSPPVRVLRAILATSSATYAITMAIDAAEHFRLEKEATGHYLRWVAVPPSESTLHAGILGSLVTAMASARRPPRRPRARDHVMLFAPAAFLAIGWLDEIVFHRRRVLMREEIIHAVQHLSEGIMWTALYALRILTRNASR